MESISRENFFLIDCKSKGGTNSGDGSNSLPAGRFSISLQTIRNLDTAIIQQITSSLGLAFINPNEANGEVCFANERGLRPEFRQSFTATDLLDYIFAVLHGNSNSEKYEQFLKTGVAQIPYPTNTDNFWQLVQTGGRLR